MRSFSGRTLELSLEVVLPRENEEGRPRPKERRVQGCGAQVWFPLRMPSAFH